jgi:hypothetical protein
VDRTASGLCLMTGFGTGGVEPSTFSTIDLVS